jgi:hypothetical protein
MAVIQQMSRSKLLARAKKFIFSTALDDSASRLCQLNFRYGLAKMHLVQEKLGMNPDVTFIAAPDCTITRNLERWRNGIGYGGKITWGDGTQPLVFIDTMPNGCGMLVGSLEEIPDPIELIQRVHDMNDSSGEVEIEGVPIYWNFGSGNHFINVFEIIPNPALSVGLDLPQYSFITHSSPSELKNDANPKNLGLYYHESPKLREISERLETPFGGINYLIDDAAKKYLEFYRWADKIGEKRRILAGKLLFEDNFKIITNQNHQGMVHLNEVVLGAYVFNPMREDLYPLTLRADLPCYLLKGVPNFTDEAMETLNFTERIKHYGLEERLSNANILPHGGGYTFPHIVAIPEIFETVEKRRYFSVDLGTGIGTMIFESPRELQFAYRGRNVVVQTIDLGLGEIVARMVPRFALKI